MTVKNQLFIGHGYDSTTIAEYIYKNFAHFLPTIKPWISTDNKCLNQGSNFPTNITTAIENSLAGLILLTDQNKKNPWINFEIGVLQGLNIPIFTMLCGDFSKEGLVRADHPIADLGVNFTLPNQDSFYGFCTNLNELLPKENRVDDNFLINSVDTNFSGFINKYNEIFDNRHAYINDIIADLED